MAYTLNPFTGQFDAKGSGVTIAGGSLTTGGIVIAATATTIESTARPTDGELLIGSTGIDPVLSTLTAGEAIDITNASGSITILCEDATDSNKGVASFDAYDFSITSGNVTLRPGSNIYFVGKHGNDSADGLTWESAKLTIQAAITAASSGDVVVGYDKGTYTENLTAATGIDVYMPNATLAGAHSLADNVSWTFHSATVATGLLGFILNTASAEAHLHLERCVGSGSGILFIGLQGKFFIHCAFCEVVTGYVVGATTAEEIYLEFGEIEISGAGFAVGVTAGADVNLNGQCIEDGGAGTLFWGTPGSTANIAVICSKVEIENLSNINANIHGELTSAHISGTLTESGAGNVRLVSGERVDNVVIGSVIPVAGTFTTCNATTFDTNVAAAGVTLSGTTLAADGADSNIPITLTPKGTEAVTIDGLDYPMADGNADECMITNGSAVLSLGVLGIAGGGTGQTGQTAAFDALSPTTTKGDVIVHNGSDNIRLAVGTNDHVLTADSGEASGVKWAAAAGGGGDFLPAFDNNALDDDGSHYHVLQSIAYPVETTFQCGYADEYQWIPIQIRADVTVTNVGFYQSGSTVGQNFRFAIFTDDNGDVGTRLFESGVLSGASTGFKWYTASISFTAGPAWLIIVAEDTNNLLLVSTKYAVGVGTQATSSALKTSTWSGETYGEIPSNLTMAGKTLDTYDLSIPIIYIQV